MSEDRPLFCMVMTSALLKLLNNSSYLSSTFVGVVVICVVCVSLIGVVVVRMECLTGTSELAHMTLNSKLNLKDGKKFSFDPSLDTVRTVHFSKLNLGGGGGGQL